MATATLQAPKIAQRSSRIGALDGWRGIAILLVLADHTQLRLFGHWPWSETGQHGVTMFFVLSGFLITGNLIKRPDLKRFYLRRFFRLMPAAWVFLCAVFVYGVFTGFATVSAKEEISALAFFRNYTAPDNWMTLHFWSLSMEIQFYLVWPAILILCGVRRARWVAIFGMVGIATWRLLLWGAYENFPLDFRTEVRADALLAGALLAFILANPEWRDATKAAVKYLRWPSLTLLVFCIARFPTLIPLIEDLAIAALVGFTVLYPQSRTSRLLAWKPLAWLGLISYSLYLWQQPFFWKGFPAWAICLAPAIAAASYYGIEQPCNKLAR